MPVLQSELKPYWGPRCQKQPTTAKAVCFSLFRHLLQLYSGPRYFPPPLWLLSLAQSLSDCNRDPSSTFSFNPQPVLTARHLRAPLGSGIIYPRGGRRHWEERVQGRQVSGPNCRTDDKRLRRTGLAYRLIAITCFGLSEWRPVGIQRSDCNMAYVNHCKGWMRHNVSSALGNLFNVKVDSFPLLSMEGIFKKFNSIKYNFKICEFNEASFLYKTLLLQG